MKLKHFLVTLSFLVCSFQFGACSNVETDLEAEMAHQPLTCVQWLDPGQQFCAVYRPDPGPGQFDCTSDKNAYTGEILFDTGSGGSGYCIGTTNTSGNMGDMNDWVNSTKNCQSGARNLYEHANSGGSSILRYVSCGTWVNVSSGWENRISSFAP